MQDLGQGNYIVMNKEYDRREYTTARGARATDTESTCVEV